LRNDHEQLIRRFNAVADWLVHFTIAMAGGCHVASMTAWSGQ
jgi:hypothetical protein